MSIESMAIVLHHSKAKGTAKLILVGIANHDGDGGAFPSMTTLGTYGGCDVRNARKHVRRLEELGEVRVYLQAGDLKDPRTKERLPDELQPNRYEVLVQCPPWCDRTRNHRDTRKGFRGPTMPLWINPRTESPPGQDPRTESPGGPPDGIAPLTVHSQPPPQGPPSPTGHARPAGPPCHVCSQTELECQRRQTRWLHEDRHPFTARKAKP